MKKIRNLRNQKGFTLVEVLIVVILLGVLAAMVVPRMITQTGAADTAEAIQMLGTIRRLAVARIDSGTAVPAFASGTSMAAGSPWQQLGMGVLPGNRRFNYFNTVDAAGAPAATALLINGQANQTLTITYDTGLFTCGAGYTAVVSSGITVGCR